MPGTRIYAATDEGIVEDLGDRIRRHRLAQNVTQRDLAARTVVSIGTIQALEAGHGKLTTLVAVLRELGLLHELEHFLEPPELSPLKLAARDSRRHTRQRARGPRPSGSE